MISIERNNIAVVIDVANPINSPGLYIIFVVDIGFL